MSFFLCLMPDKTCTITRMDVCASVYLLLVKCCVDIAMMVLCFFFCLYCRSLAVLFFAALCKEDLNYSQPMNQLTLICPLLNLNPKKLFCLDFGLDRPLALSVGQLADRVVGVSSLEPIGVRSVRFRIGSGALWRGRGYGGTHCLDVDASTLA